VTRAAPRSIANGKGGELGGENGPHPFSPRNKKEKDALDTKKGTKFNWKKRDTAAGGEKFAKEQKKTQVTE